MATGTWESPYKFNGKEIDQETGLYYYGARYYEPNSTIWYGVDPLAEKYPEYGGYVYCLNNPVKFIDPDGRYTEVAANENGTYTVVNGKLNDDKVIYIVEQNKRGEYKRTGQKLGNSMTENSFFGDNGKVVKGAVINPNDQSGQKFIDNEIKADDPNIVSYIINAGNGEKYDFKERNIDKRGEISKNQYRYRGMPFKDENGNTVYGSARDIGNYGAGYIAGKSGLNWKSARLGFDLYQSYKSQSLTTESITTQRAERLGHNTGSMQYSLRSGNDFLKRVFNMPTTKPKGFLGF